MLKLFAFYALVVPLNAGPTIHVYNKCPFDIWPGIQGNPLVENGGFHLGAGQTQSFQVPDGWTGARIWARRNCDSNMNCDSGFCGVRKNLICICFLSNPFDFLEQGRVRRSRRRPTCLFGRIYFERQWYPRLLRR